MLHDTCQWSLHAHRLVMAKIYNIIAILALFIDIHF